MGENGTIAMFSTSSETTIPLQVTRVCNGAIKKHLPFRTCDKSIFCCITFLSIDPALALVDDRLVGEGTGKILGINDPVLGWVIIGVLTTIWAVYYTATKELGGQREED